jgi:hypothetical protein
MILSRMLAGSKLRVDDSAISGNVGAGANGLKNAFGSYSAGCGTDCGVGSSTDFRELEAVYSAIIEDAIGGPSFSTVVVVC